MSIDLAPNELDTDITADAQSDVDTELEPNDPLSGGVPNVAYLQGAMRNTGIPEIGNVPGEVIALWDVQTRLTVMEFCRGPEFPESDDWPALPEVLKQYFPDEPDEPADERSWRAWPLESLTSMGLQPRALKAMAGAGLETVGQLSDWQAKHGDFWIKEIKGIGKKVGDNVADVMERFWRERPDRKAAMEE